MAADDRASHNCNHIPLLAAPWCLSPSSSGSTLEDKWPLSLMNKLVPSFCHCSFFQGLELDLCASKTWERMWRCADSLSVQAPSLEPYL